MTGSRCQPGAAASDPDQPFVAREPSRSKAERYAALVTARQAYDAEGVLGLTNPSKVENGRYDDDEIGPWTRWAGDLDADLMVVGQDWGDVRYFVANRGLDKPGNPTSTALAELLASVGRPVPPPPSADALPEPEAHRHSRVFLTNALLWLKGGGLSSAVQEAWFTGDSEAFLLDQIAIVQPRIVVALGQQAHRAILRACKLPLPTGLFRDVVESVDGTSLPGLPRETQLFGVYHCGVRIRNTLRSVDQQRRDWERIACALRRD